MVNCDNVLFTTSTRNDISCPVVQREQPNINKFLSPDTAPLLTSHFQFCHPKPSFIFVLPSCTKFTEEHKCKTGGIHFFLIYTPLSPFAFNSATSPVLPISLAIQLYYANEFNILPLNSATPPSC